MPNVVERLSGWPRQAVTSIAAWFRRAAPAEGPEPADDNLVYRLRHWPRIPSASKTADLLRTLSMMSHRPVNRRWILNNSRMNAGEVDGLLRRLVRQGAVHVIDAGSYRADTNAA